LEQKKNVTGAQLCALGVATDTVEKKKKQRRKENEKQREEQEVATSTRKADRQPLVEGSREKKHSLGEKETTR
jgi:hypothetical protein